MLLVGLDERGRRSKFVKNVAAIDDGYPCDKRRGEVGSVCVHRMRIMDVGDDAAVIVRSRWLM